MVNYQVKLKLAQESLPSFSISGNPDSNDEFTIENYSYGKEYINTKYARSLAIKSARICGMEKRRFLWKTVLSKIAP